MNELIDYWAEDDFEETVAAGIISCYEGKIKKNKDGDNISDDHLKLFRAYGPYFPSQQRIALDSGEDINEGIFDLKNDRLPNAGCFSFRGNFESGKNKYNTGYCQTALFRKAKNLGKNWQPMIEGVNYEMAMLLFNNEKIHGFRGYFTVSRTGLVRFCNKSVSNIKGYVPGVKQQMLSLFTHDHKVYKERQAWAFFGLQFLSDRRFCWTISAKEKLAKAHLGCAKEEIKSLLYARTLPMTETGRKRPILHLVEAHKRRIKSGVDIDVTMFLRGQQTVEIGGTLFTVNPPENIYLNVSKPSQEKYYSAA